NVTASRLAVVGVANAVFQGAAVAVVIFVESRSMYASDVSKQPQLQAELGAVFAEPLTAQVNLWIDLERVTVIAVNVLIGVVPNTVVIPILVGGRLELVGAVSRRIQIAITVIDLSVPALGAFVLVVVLESGVDTEFKVLGGEVTPRDDPVVPTFIGVGPIDAQ